MIRIKCKPPAFPEPVEPPSLEYPTINRFLPTIGDCEVYHVDEQGNERALLEVQAIRFEVACDGEPARCSLELSDVELEVDSPLRDLADARAARVDEWISKNGYLILDEVLSELVEANRIRVPEEKA